MEIIKKLPPDQVNVSPQNPLRIFLTLLVLSAMLLGGVYLVSGLLINLAVPYIPWSWEQSWGDHLIAQMVRENPEPSPEELKLQARLDQLSARQKDPERRFTVHIVKNSTVNAVALPGGHILFFQGLLDLLDDPKEMDFVLAHELAHFEHRDHLRGLGRRLVLIALSTIFMGDGGSIDGLLSGSLGGLESKFSQDQEQNADLYALKLIWCTHGSTGGAVELLTKLAARDDASELAYFFSSHPRPQDRVYAAKRLISGNSYKNCP